MVDTAGRLHTQSNLMDELAKVRRVIESRLDGAPHETLLVVDATTGQNGLQQARLFGAAAQVTGVALTKLDGSAKGGVAVAIAHELGLPVKLVGVGEDDRRPAPVRRRRLRAGSRRQIMSPGWARQWFARGSTGDRVVGLAYRVLRREEVGGVAVAVFMHFPGLRREEYDRLMADLALDANPPLGEILHVAADAPYGINVVDLWQTKESAESFVEQRLRPALQARGVDVELTIDVLPLRNVFAPDLDTIGRIGAVSLPGRAGGAPL